MMPFVLILVILLPLAGGLLLLAAPGGRGALIKILGLAVSTATFLRGVLDEGGGLSLANAAYVTQYFSQPGADPTGRHQYDATVSSVATVTTPLPAGISKSVSVSTATIGDMVVYTIRVPSTTVNATLYDLRIQDVIPAGVSISGVSNNSASLNPGACVAYQSCSKGKMLSNRSTFCSNCCARPGREAHTCGEMYCTILGSQLWKVPRSRLT